VHRIVHRMMSNEMQQKFNLTGVHGKHSFSDVLEPLVSGRPSTLSTVLVRQDDQLMFMLFENYLKLIYSVLNNEIGHQHMKQIIKSHKSKYTDNFKTEVY
jgi:hypothetical protein